MVCSAEEKEESDDSDDDDDDNADNKLTATSSAITTLIPFLLHFHPSHLLQLSHQPHPGVSQGKRLAGRGGRERQAEPDETGSLHQLP